MATPFTNALQKAVDKFNGTVRVDNANNPQSAAYKAMQPKVSKTPMTPFVSSLPKKQKMFGVGVGY